MSYDLQNLADCDDGEIILQEWLSQRYLDGFNTAKEQIRQEMRQLAAVWLANPIRLDFNAVMQAVDSVQPPSEAKK